MGWSWPGRGDLVAGVSVGLVLIPQSFAYATLAGMPPERGLVVAIVATLAAAPLASSPYLQTGPVAITSLLTLGALQPLAEVGTDEFIKLGMLLAIMVGLVRILVGAVREGGITYLLSRPVLAGFAPAAALVIAFSQLPLALDVDVDGHVALRAVDALSRPGDWHLGALALAVLSVVALLACSRRWPRFPTVVALVVVGIAVERFTPYGGAVVGDLPGIGFGVSFDLPWSRIANLAVPAVVIALVGFGDVAAVARTYAAETRTRWDANREFLSQGAANVASGLVGGFPAGGSFSRSALGRMAGARTTWSGAIAGLTTLAFLPFVGVLSDLPVAVLAGIIIASVAKLLRARQLRELWKLSLPQFLIAGTTYVATLVTAPQIQLALELGLFLSVGWHLRRETLLAVEVWTDPVTVHLRPSGVLYFGSAHLIGDHLRDALAEHPDAKRLIIHGDRLGRVDVTGALELRSLLRDAERAGIITEITDLVPAGRKIINRTMEARPPEADRVLEADAGR